MAIGHPAAVTDALKPRRQRVDEKTPDELIGAERHGARFLLVLVAIVLPLESDAAIGGRQKALIGNGHAVGVSAEVLEDLLRPAERRLGVDDPLFLAQWHQILGELGWFGERFQLAEKL